MPEIKSMYRTRVEAQHPKELGVTLQYGGVAVPKAVKRVLPPILYDGIMALSGGHVETIIFKPADFNLRYGTNPNQPATIYIPDKCNFAIKELKTGKGGLSLTNVEDAFRGANCLKYYKNGKSCAVMKHENPSGAAVANTQPEAFKKSWYGDRIAASGCTATFGDGLERKTAEVILERTEPDKKGETKAKYFVEVVAAPDFDQGVIDLLQRRGNMRIVQYIGLDNLPKYAGDRFMPWLRPIAGLDGMLGLEDPFTSVYREPEDLLKGYPKKEGTGVVTDRGPTPEELVSMLFGIRLACALRSNGVAIVKGGDSAEYSISPGTGQQDRVRAVRQAIRRAKELSTDARRSGIERGDYDIQGSVLASDGLFPYPDSVMACGKAGVSAIVQPGGSERDEDSIKAANKYGIAMVFTGERYFSHH